jgi:hypothetical protein
MKFNYTIESFQRKILQRFDNVESAFDLEEILSLAQNEQERLLAWNAAMVLVEQGRVHVLQLKDKNTGAVRWLMVDFPYQVLSNKTWEAPGRIIPLKD